MPMQSFFSKVQAICEKMQKVIFLEFSMPHIFKGKVREISPLEVFGGPFGPYATTPNTFYRSKMHRLVVEILLSKVVVWSGFLFWYGT